MSLPDNANPVFLAWLRAQSEAVRDDVDAYWGETVSDTALFPGHRSNDYARLTSVIAYCRKEHGYAG